MTKPNQIELHAQALPTTGKDMADLLSRADKQNPSPADVAAMRALLAQPDSELWQISGDLARLARDQMIRKAGEGATFRESVKIGLERLAAELAGADAPPLERMLAEHAALCWAQYHLMQIRYESVTAGSISLSQGDYWERRLSAAQRRYLRGLEALARARRLLRPGAVQVNIGQQVTAAQMVKTKQG